MSWLENSSPHTHLLPASIRNLTIEDNVSSSIQTVLVWAAQSSPMLTFLKLQGLVSTFNAVPAVSFIQSISATLRDLFIEFYFEDWNPLDSTIELGLSTCSEMRSLELNFASPGWLQASLKPPPCLQILTLHMPYSVVIERRPVIGQHRQSEWEGFDDFLSSSRLSSLKELWIQDRRIRFPFHGCRDIYPSSPVFE
ncbi:hypothetical protein C8J56DRAFT_221365 [Mycena floridula]|nr:hypothetical protein C8J56DRAFT_221365 [Mycena floridula]